MMLFQTLKNRWKAETPLLFKNVVRICGAVSAISMSMHGACVVAGAVEPLWWCNIYPYLVGVPAGMALIAKLTAKDGNYGQKEDENNGRL